MKTSLRNRFISPALLVGCAAAIGIAGCGGGDSSSTVASTGVSGASGAAGATPLSQDDFVSQANSICADANSQIAGLTAPTNDAQSIAQFTTDGLAILKPAVGQLSALVPPADLQDQWSQWLDESQQTVKDEEQLQGAAQSGDMAAVQSIAQQTKTHNNAHHQLATDMGLTECAKDVQPQG